jgi:phage shock protein E
MPNLFGVVLAVVIAGGISMILRMRPDIRSGDARRLVEEGARLVDVRSPLEFESGHLPGAVNIPLPELERRIAELEPRERAIVVYCASGARSAQARRVLSARGFALVRNLGPMSAWG